MSKAILKALQRNMRQSLEQGHLQEAGDILVRLKREDPLSRETRGFELEYYLLSDRLSEAKSLASQLCRMFPDSGRIFFLAGKVAYRQKRYPEAESCFRESHRIYPSRQAQLWLGKTLTQRGRWDEAEALLKSVLDYSDFSWLDLGWLYERKDDLEAALQAVESFLRLHPEHEFASRQRIRIKARMLEPQALVEEVHTLVELGEPVPDSLYPEYIEKLLHTGQSQRAREEVRAQLAKMEPKLGTHLAWICYQAQAYDLACDLFMSYLEGNTSNYKYLTALESAAAKCNRLREVIETYQKVATTEPKLHGRVKSLSRRLGKKG